MIYSFYSVCQLIFTDAAVVCFDVPAMSVRSLGNALTSMGNASTIQIVLRIPIGVRIAEDAYPPGYKSIPWGMPPSSQASFKRVHRDTEYRFRAL